MSTIGRSHWQTSELGYPYHYATSPLVGDPKVPKPHSLTYHCATSTPIHIEGLAETERRLNTADVYFFLGNLGHCPGDHGNPFILGADILSPLAHLSWPVFITKLHRGTKPLLLLLMLLFSPIPTSPRPALS